jgi:biopolymer transport protein ExbD
MKNYFFLILIYSLFFSSCTEEVTKPKNKSEYLIEKNPDYLKTEEASQNKTKDKFLTVFINSSNDYLVNDKKVLLENLENNILSYTDSLLTIELSVNPKADYFYVNEVINIAKQNQLKIALLPQK